MNEADHEHSGVTFSEAILVEFTDIWRPMTDEDRELARIREEERKRRNPPEPDPSDK